MTGKAHGGYQSYETAPTFRGTQCVEPDRLNGLAHARSAAGIAAKHTTQNNKNRSSVSGT